MTIEGITEAMRENAHGEGAGYGESRALADDLLIKLIELLAGEVSEAKREQINAILKDYRSFHKWYE